MQRNHLAQPGSVAISNGLRASSVGRMGAASAAPAVGGSRAFSGERGAATAVASSGPATSAPPAARGPSQYLPRQSNVRVQRSGVGVSRASAGRSSQRRQHVAEFAQEREQLTEVRFGVSKEF